MTTNITTKDELQAEGYTYQERHFGNCEVWAKDLKSKLVEVLADGRCIVKTTLDFSQKGCTPKR